MSMMGIASNDDVWLKLGKRLLESGADPNETSTKGISLISTAIKRNLVDLLELLVRYGANVNLMDARRQTPLAYAREMRIFDREFKIVRTLLKYPVKWNKRNFIDHLWIVSVNAIRYSKNTPCGYKNQKLTFNLNSVFTFSSPGQI
ncbi:uncharacterized protein LOC134253082 [Saccostrea cucullata]|uniref:uncharacterized protein LOC134253082 n=1 Tax=Saccostrea cuccullata TaxID=36930 RepID=UPI002ED6A7CC